MFINHYEVSDGSAYDYETFSKNGHCYYRHSRFIDSQARLRWSFSDFSEWKYTKTNTRKRHYTHPKDCIQRGKIINEKSFKTNRFTKSGIAGCLESCTSTDGCNYIQYDELKGWCQHFKSNKPKFEWDSKTTDFMKTTNVLAPHNCRLLRFAGSHPKILYNKTLTSLSSVCEFVDTDDLPDALYTCKNYRNKILGPIRQVQTELANFKVQVLNLAPKNISVETRERRAALAPVLGPLVPMAVAALSTATSAFFPKIVTAIGNNFGVITKVTSTILPQIGTKSLSTLKDIIQHDGYSSTMFKDTTFSPLTRILTSKAAPPKDESAFHTSLNRFGTFLYSIKNRTAQITNFYGTIIQNNVPQTQTIKESNYIYTTWLEDSDLFRNFIYSNFTQSHLSLAFEIPLNNSFYKFSTWKSNIDSLQNITNNNSCGKRRVKRGIATGQKSCQPKFSIKKVAENIFVLSFSDKLFGFNLVLSNSHTDFITFNCDGQFFKFSSIPFSVFSCGKDCDIHVSNKLVLSGLQTEKSIFKPQLLYRRPPLHGESVEIGNIGNYLKKLNLNEVLQYFIMGCLFLAQISLFFVKRMCYLRGKKAAKPKSKSYQKNEDLPLLPPAMPPLGKLDYPRQMLKNVPTTESGEIGDVELEIKFPEFSSFKPPINITTIEEED